MTWLSRRKYLVLMVTVGVLLLVYPPLHEFLDGRLVYNLLVTAVILAVFQAVFTRRAFFLVALAPGAAVLAANWVDYVIPGLPRLPVLVALHLCGAFFVGLTVVAILRDIYLAEVITADGIIGAFCGYLLLGLTFGHLYCALAAVAPGSFQGTTPLPADEGARFFFLSYYSLITLTTVGYGDIAPATPPARSLTIVEALLGQFYLAVLVAELVGKRVSQAVTGEGRSQ